VAGVWKLFFTFWTDQQTISIIAGLMLFLVRKAAQSRANLCQLD
jgi:hypothetical protein